MSNTPRSPMNNGEFYGDTAALVCACRNGDDAARVEFITRFSPFIERKVAAKLAKMCSLSSSLRGHVEDVRNDILERLLKNNCEILSKLKDTEKIDGWLAVLSRNYVVDYLRKHGSRGRASELEIEDHSILQIESGLESLIERERAEILAVQLAALPTFDRLLMEMYYSKGLKYAEIAEITNQNIDTVSSRP